MFFKMLIGIPGSGKSTWAKSNYEKDNNTVILSSDEYRQRLLGNVNIQDKNNYIFQQLNKDTKINLLRNKNVVYDATNVSIKNRKNILESVKSLCIPNLEVEAIIFMTYISECKDRNLKRDRRVPEFVIDSMVRKFQFPLEKEGFTKITVINNSEFSSPIANYNDYLEINGKNFDQKNPHHSLTLYEHCKKCKENILSFYSDEVKIAAYLHDIGKLYTQSFDENNIAHYYNHENFGAYFAWFLNYPNNINKYNVCKLINYHMLPYFWSKMSDKKRIASQTLFTNREFFDIIEIHRCDELAH